MWAVILLVTVIAVHLVALVYLLGWIRGFDASSNITNWGTGFDDGYKACIKNMGMEDSGQAP